ncbi:DNA cytosine methyltransferase, partial [Acidomonas methanolica]|uniref:DNA cytosine methyltransferase n=1 Tax=Acidomonas methanolica TaxID=437 RepID=UPI00164C40DC
MTRASLPTGATSPRAPFRVLDLFAGAAGGWTLGLHRAGFVTVAACEIVPWRRVLYAENNPHVRKRSWLIGFDPRQLADT